MLVFSPEFQQDRATACSTSAPPSEFSRRQKTGPVPNSLPSNFDVAPMLTPSMHRLSIFAFVLLVCLAISACEPTAAELREQRSIADRVATQQKEIEEAAKKQAKEHRELEEEREKSAYCTNQIESMKTEARKAKKEKKYASVVDILKPCYGTTSDGEAVELYISSIETLKAVEAKRVAIDTKRRGVAIGMTKEQVVASSWGRPQNINQSHGSFGTHEQWVYTGGYLYFENGILSAVQN